MAAQKIILDLQKISDLNSGLGQFSWHLASELLKLEPSIELYLPEEAMALFPQAKKHCQKKWQRYWSGFAPSGQLFHSLHQEAPYVSQSNTSLLTIHDLNFILEDRSDSAKKRWLRGVQKRIDRASGIAYISRYARDLTREKLDVSGKIEKVIYNGVAIRQDLPAERHSVVGDSPFFFSVATVVAKKNFHVLIDAMKKLPQYKMYLAGSKDSKYARAMQEKIDQMNMSDQFILLGKIKEQEKNWLYQNCQAVMFPSLQEGFGLPVIEAMHYGKPVFLSKFCALPEIGGNVAFYFDNFEAESMAELIESKMKEFAKDSQLVGQLHERAARFSWANAAKEYQQFYRELLNQ